MCMIYMFGLFGLVLLIVCGQQFVFVVLVLVVVVDVVCNIVIVVEVFVIFMILVDNIDLFISWIMLDGQCWLIVIVKVIDKLVVYDGQIGMYLCDVGSMGIGLGQFVWFNGIVVVDDLVLIVECDNYCVQVLWLLDFVLLGVFVVDDLCKLYGLWVNKCEGGYDVYVIDFYDVGEDV